LNANPGCFAGLTCSDRIALSRISAALRDRPEAEHETLIRQEIQKLPSAQRARILRGVLTGASALSDRSPTELTPTDQANITFIEEIPGITALSEDLKKAANDLAHEARSIRDSSLASHLWMIVSDGTEVGVSGLLGIQPRGVPLVKGAEAYRTQFATLENRVRSSLTLRRLPDETVRELRESYAKRMNQLSEQLVLEIDQATAALE